MTPDGAAAPAPSADAPSGLFVLDRPDHFSGQVAASREIIRGLEELGYPTRTVELPGLERDRGWAPARVVNYLGALLGGWARFAHALPNAAYIHLTLGQSYHSLLKFLPPLWLARIFRSSLDVTISLNGSLFRRWSSDAPLAALFVRTLSLADRITVVGPSHAAALRALGVRDLDVVVAPNPSTVTPLTREEVEAKHRVDAGGEIRVLFLSSLVEAKGFPEFLEALLALSVGSPRSPAEGHPDPAIRGILCGPITRTPWCTRFASREEAASWIYGMIRDISEGGLVQAEWIEGAFGEEKAALFREAHIFVLPSTYAVEAQPLVLLEAMATGCAIVTSTAGEIPSTLSPREGILLDNPTTPLIASAIESLAGDGEHRSEMAQAALELFLGRYARDAYLSRWLSILGLDPHRTR